MGMITLTKEERLYIVREYMDVYGDSLEEACERFRHELELIESGECDVEALLEQRDVEAKDCGTCNHRNGECYCLCHAD
jgi:hypothetical protein